MTLQTKAAAAPHKAVVPLQQHFGVPPYLLACSALEHKQFVQHLCCKNHRPDRSSLPVGNPSIALGKCTHAASSPRLLLT